MKSTSAIVAVVAVLVLFLWARPRRRGSPTCAWPMLGSPGSILPHHRDHPCFPLLRCFPYKAWWGPSPPYLWFEVVLGLSALSLAALTVASLGGPAFTP